MLIVQDKIDGASSGFFYYSFGLLELLLEVPKTFRVLVLQNSIFFVANESEHVELSESNVKVPPLQLYCAT